MTTPRETTADELVSIVGDSITDADLVRARALASLVDVRLARLDGLRRELAIRRSVDEADPRLTELQARIALEELTVRGLDGEALRAVDQPSAPAGGETVVGGRIVPETGRVPRGSRVELRDASNNPVPGIEAELDATGTFRVRVPADRRRALVGPVSVVVVNAKDEVVARHPDTVDPTSGAAAYREIPLAPAALRVLDDSAGTLGIAPIRGRARVRAAGRETPATGTPPAAGTPPAGGPAPRARTTRPRTPPTR